jgi:hypothetical protein
MSLRCEVVNSSAAGENIVNGYLLPRIRTRSRTCFIGRRYRVNYWFLCVNLGWFSACAGTALALCYVTLAVKFQDDRVMDQSINCRQRRHRILEDFIPLAEHQVGADQHARASDPSVSPIFSRLLSPSGSRYTSWEPISE